MGLGHRYMFQNQEADNEFKGFGNSYNYRYRMHDARLGRFFSVDPLTAKYPHNSPYAFSENSTIAFIELEGLERFYAADGEYLGKYGTSNKIRVVDERETTDAKKHLNNQNGVPSGYFTNYLMFASKPIYDFDYKEISKIFNTIWIEWFKEDRTIVAAHDGSHASKSDKIVQIEIDIRNQKEDNYYLFLSRMVHEWWHIVAGTKGYYGDFNSMGHEENYMKSIEHAKENDYWDELDESYKEDLKDKVKEYIAENTYLYEKHNYPEGGWRKKLEDVKKLYEKTFDVKLKVIRDPRTNVESDYKTIETPNNTKQRPTTYDPGGNTD